MRKNQPPPRYVRGVGGARTQQRESIKKTISHEYTCRFFREKQSRCSTFGEQNYEYKDLRGGLL